MQCLYVAGIWTEYPIKRGTRPLMGGLKCSVFIWLGSGVSICLGEVSSYGRLKLQSVRSSDHDLVST